MFIIGITGSFGSGKTTVAKFLMRKKVKVLNADKIAHELIGSKGKCSNSIIKIFGPEILVQKKIDRKKLGQIVFDNKQHLKDLCAIVHPQVIKEIKKEVAIWKKEERFNFIIIDAPLLIEAGLNSICDVVIVVKANLQKQIGRIKKQKYFKEHEILKRIKAQMPLKKKLAFADFIIDNRGTLKQTKKQTEDIWKRILEI